MNGSSPPVIDAGISPHWRELEIDGLALTARAFVPPTLEFFDDHFHGNPLVPGVVQLLWLQALAERAWPEHCLDQNRVHSVLSGHRRVKFKQPVRPGDDLHITLNAAAPVFAFTLDNGSGRCTDGQLLYSGQSSAETGKSHP